MNNRLDTTEESTSEHETCRKRIKINNWNNSELWDDVKQPDVHVIEVLQRLEDGDGDSKIYLKKKLL